MQNTRVKLLFFLAVWKRPEITEICFLGLNRLRKQPDYDINVLAVISEESMIPLCEKYDVEWCMHENQPLGAKKNFGLAQAMMKKDFDYMVEIGSDDLLKNEFLNLYPWDKDVFALSDFIIMNTEDGECRRLTKRDAYYGTGRAISRKALEKTGNLWVDKLNMGLDNASTVALAKKGFGERRISTAEPVVIDLKSEVNIWPFEKKGIEYPLEEALKGLSEEEVNAIKCLTTANRLESLTSA